ncbi:hypothetical protein CYMTET_35678 [Cymbomonas tetramitiformis]|uniref:Uncharacterized protein n=1 Tax=Cymbomonas tetramitiformis TaxID=36881 RepID=A0AAE0F907_9CHLO|nr:hypothetical protein CYMTET_35678 [Cymbomonas tetramitiformis]|eukprot:gene297-552_t
MNSETSILITEAPREFEILPTLRTCAVFNNLFAEDRHAMPQDWRDTQCRLMRMSTFARVCDSLAADRLSDSRLCLYTRKKYLRWYATAAIDAADDVHVERQTSLAYAWAERSHFDSTDELFDKCVQVGMRSGFSHKWACACTRLIEAYGSAEKFYRSCAARDDLTSPASTSAYVDYIRCATAYRKVVAKGGGSRSSTPMSEWEDVEVL